MTVMLVIAPRALPFRLFSLGTLTELIVTVADDAGYAVWGLCVAEVFWLFVDNRWGISCLWGIAIVWLVSCSLGQPASLLVSFYSLVSLVLL